MVIMKLFFILLFCIFSVTCAVAYFEEYNACHAYKNGDNACAQKLYDELLTRQPDNASAAYNCGKIALKEKEFEKAEAYFNHVTKNGAAPNSLREQAWYDAGLSFVHRELWQDALSSFQEVLKINPDNEYAKKMIEQIQKKLDEQKQQEEQQKNDEQSCDDEKKDNDDSQKNDQNDSQSDEHEKNDDQKDSEEQKSDEQSQNSDNRDPHDQSSENSQQQDQHERNNNQNNPQPQQNKQEEQQQSEQPKPQQPEKQESAASDERDKKASSKSQQAQEQKELPDTKKAGTYGNQKPQDKESKLLELVEQHDAQASKALFKRQIQQQMPSYYGQKNW
jgi:Ca-activated chloride channel family protein